MKNTTMGSVGAGTPTQNQLPVKVRYCLYARKSTESEERQILSIDSQVKEMLQIAEREGSVIEKRELLFCIKNKLILTQKVLTIEKK